MTIKDIARLSGVSVSTVSRVMNNHPDVSEDNRKKVQAVIESSRFVPSSSARDLVRTTSDAIGVIVRGVGNPFYTPVITAIEREIQNTGYTMVISQINETDDEITCASVMERDKRLLGVIFVGGRFDYSREDLSRLTIPFVCCTFTNRYGSLRENEYSSVSIEDEKEACRAVTILTELGHRRIAALITGTDDHSISQLRYQGYKRALQARDLSVEPELVLCAEAFTLEEAYRKTKQAIREGIRFTALFAISDNMAIGAMRALHEEGIRVPEDCSVIGIDGLEISDYVVPRLTTLSQPKEKIGKITVDILTDMISGSAGHRNVVLDTELRTGETILACSM